MGKLSENNIKTPKGTLNQILNTCKENCLETLRKSRFFHILTTPLIPIDGHISIHIKVIINCFFIFFPALIQYLMFQDIEYLLSFLFCLIFSYLVLIVSKVNIFVTVPFMLISFLYTTFLFLYKKSPGSATIMLLFNTKIEAIINSLFSPFGIGILILFPFAFILYIRFLITKTKASSKELTKKRKNVYIAMILTIIVVFTMNQSIFCSTYPFSLFYDYNSYSRILARMQKISLQTFNLSGVKDDNFEEKNDTIVMIIGESARKASWSLYGYHQKTNFFLAKVYYSNPDNFVIFRNAISTAATTYPSLMCIFSTLHSKNFSSIPDNPSVTRILRDSGYKVYYVSTYESIMANFISPTSFNILNSDDDMALLPEIEKILDDEQEKKKFIVVHLRGSHFGLCSYKFSYNDYLDTDPDCIATKYHHSILHTDIFLSKFAKKILTHNNAVCAWYFPDHGENLNDYGDGNYGHGCGNFTRFELEIPSVIFYNDKYMTEYPKKIKNLKRQSHEFISHSNVSQTLMGLCGFYPTRFYDPKRDLSSDKYSYQEPYLIDINNFPTRYSATVIE